MNDLESWEQRRRIGVVGYDEETNTIAFYHEPDDADLDYFYWFPVDEIQTYDQYNDWFEHLRAKRWFTSDVKYNLIDVLERLGQSGNFEGCDSTAKTQDLVYSA